MLQVRKHSWHYWVWRLGRDGNLPQPKNLCRYFWHIVFKIVATAVIASLVILGLTFIALTLYNHPVGSALIVVGVILVISAFIGLGYVVGGWVDRRKERYDAAYSAYVRGEGPHPKHKPAKPKKQPNLVWAFIKARKQKYCPLIQVVDE